MATLIMMCGLPGSGKSTFARKKVQEFGCEYVSRDEIRFSLLKEGEEYFAHENEVYNIFTNKIRQHLIENKVVVVDAMHLTKASRKKLLKRFNGLNFIKICIYMDVPVEVSSDRNERRNGKTKVPKDRFNQMIRNLQVPSTEEFDFIFFVNENGEFIKK